MVVSIDAKGTLRLGPDATPMTAEVLRAQLLALAEKNPELRLAISADKAAPVGQLVRVMDAAKEVKINVVTMFTKEAAKQE